MNLSQMIALAAVAFGAWSYVSGNVSKARLEAAASLLDVQQQNNEQVQRERDEARALADANYKAFMAEKAERARIEKIASDARAAATKRAADLATALKRIKNAPKSFDGPVAPVLRHELDDLRAGSVRPDAGNGDAPADGADPGATGTPGDQSSDPAVPAQAPTS